MNRFTRRAAVKMYATGFVAMLAAIYAAPQVYAQGGFSDLDKDVTIALIALIGAVVTIFGQFVAFLQSVAKRKQRSAIPPHTHEEIAVLIKRFDELENVVSERRKAAMDDHQTMWGAIGQMQRELGGMRTDMAIGQESQIRRFDALKLTVEKDVQAGKDARELLIAVATALGINVKKNSDE